MRDIVERLKESVRLTWSKSNEEMCKAAIDEIERLRGQVQQLQDAVMQKDVEIAELMREREDERGGCGSPAMAEAASKMIAKQLDEQIMGKTQVAPVV